MKRFLLASILSVYFIGSLLAIEINGDFTSETRILFEDFEYLSNNERGLLAIEGLVEEKLFAKLALELGYLNNPLSLISGQSLLMLDELAQAQALSPFEILFSEAYFIYYDFICEGLDLSFGKQKINWGVLDLCPPTEVLNPLDLADPFSFNKKNSSLTLVLTYTIPQTDIYFSLLAQPYSGVARLNKLLLSQLESALIQPPLIPGVNPQAGIVQTPEAILENGSIAARFGFSIWGMDFAISYANHLSDLPLVKDITIEGGPQTNITSYKMSYYREQMFGLEFAKDWEIFITKAELAVFFQPEQIVTINITGLGELRQTALKADPFCKFGFGLEKDFGGGFKMLAQYLHGFNGERGNEGLQRLQDYFLLYLELSLLEDKLSFGLNGLLNLNTALDFLQASDPTQYFKDHWGLQAGFEISYKPILSLCLKLGIIFFTGAEASRLGSFDKYDHFYLSANYKF